MKPLLCIRPQRNAPLGIMSGVLDDAGVEWRYVDLWRGDAVPDISEAGGLVVLGGSMNADEDDAFPWLGDVRELMRQAVDAELPLLGSCLGAQLLARAADTPVVANATREIGFRKVEVTPAGRDDPLLSAFAPSARVFQFHKDASEMPAGAELLVTNDDTPVQAFRVGARAYGVQFHFEVTTREITAWADESPPEVRDEWGMTKEELLAEAAAHLEAQQVAGRRLTAAFVDLLG